MDSQLLSDKVKERYDLINRKLDAGADNLEGATNYSGGLEAKRVAVQAAYKLLDPVTTGLANRAELILAATRKVAGAEIAMGVEHPLETPEEQRVMLDKIVSTALKIAGERSPPKMKNSREGEGRF